MVAVQVHDARRGSLEPGKNSPGADHSAVLEGEDKCRPGKPVESAVLKRGDVVPGEIERCVRPHRMRGVLGAVGAGGADNTMCPL